MGDFLETSNRLLRNNDALSQSDRASFEMVFKARAALQSVHPKASLNIDNLESLYGAFDMAALFERLGNLSVSAYQRIGRGIASWGYSDSHY
jgi:hypothetical protein